MRDHYPVEVTGRPHHHAFAVEEASQVGEARRAAIRLAESLAYDEEASGRVALVVTELGNNLVRHARQGRLLIAPVLNDQGERVVEVLSLDTGPGIANPVACMTDGYSTGGTPGTGLGAARRLSEEFDVFSQVPAGTVILARVASKRKTGGAPSVPPRRNVFSVAGVALAAPRETVCGDGWSVAFDGMRALVFVADGLGHGGPAAEASVLAARVFEGAPFGAPEDVLGKVHQALRVTRGAAIAIADVTWDDRAVVFAGVGNVVGRLISGVEDRALLSQHGTAGVQVPTIRGVRYGWPLHGALIVHSDGLTTRWKLNDCLEILQHHPAVIAGWLMRDHCRGNDDATVVVLKGKS